jgi:hypothetical protein
MTDNQNIAVTPQESIITESEFDELIGGVKG